jgi:hypothetical protein
MDTPALEHSRLGASFGTERCSLHAAARRRGTRDRAEPVNVRDGACSDTDITARAGCIRQDSVSERAFRRQAAPVARAR